MTKGKKLYCTVSFLFAVAVFLLVMLAPTTGVTVHAASNDPASNWDADNSDLDLDDPNLGGDDELLDARSDSTNGLSINYNNDTGSISTPVRALLVITVVAVAPSLLMMLTSFTRIVIVLHFIRTAMGTQTTPPNQVMTGLALFLTFFIMWPTFQQINENAIQPLDNGEITMEEAFEQAAIPIREFMGGQTQQKDLAIFMDMSGEYYDITEEGAIYEIPMTMLVPAFILSELRQAFIMGFLIYIPFIVIDMVVSSVLMSMGMMMLPPTTISLPFKVLLFILADGWNLVVGSLVRTFY